MKTYGMLLESSLVYMNHYATLKTLIAQNMANRKIAFMGISIEAIMNIENLGLATKFVFITADSEELRKGLRVKQMED